MQSADEIKKMRFPVFMGLACIGTFNLSMLALGLHYLCIILRKHDIEPYSIVFPLMFVGALYCIVCFAGIYVYGPESPFSKEVSTQEEASPTGDDHDERNKRIVTKSKKKKP